MEAKELFENEELKDMVIEEVVELPAVKTVGLGTKVGVAAVLVTVATAVIIYGYNKNKKNKDEDKETKKRRFTILKTKKSDEEDGSEEN